MKFFRWLYSRCPLDSKHDAAIDRRKVSEEGRERWAEFSRERADVEERLRLVEMQAKVIAHVTDGNRAAGH